MQHVRGIMWAGLPTSRRRRTRERTVARRGKLGRIGYEWQNDPGRPREGPPVPPMRQGSVKDQNHF